MNSVTGRIGPVLVLGLVAPLLPVPSIADVAQQTGWFVEAGVVDVTSDAQFAEFTVDGDDTGLMLGVGYAFGPNLQVRMAYSDLGDHAATDCPPPRLCIIQNGDTVQFDAFTLTAQASLPLSEYLDVYARAGVMRWDADFMRFDRDDIDTDVVLGAGIGVRFVRNWRLNVEYSEVELDLETWGLGLQYRF